MSTATIDRIYNSAQPHTALLILEDGTIFEGDGFGAETINTGEICFNTSMSGYQEIMTDPSYAAQIIAFTFPHIGNVGANAVDLEAEKPAALGMITRCLPTNPSNFRATESLSNWLKANNLPGISGIDTRALTHAIRDGGAPNGVIAVNYKAEFDRPALLDMAKAWPGLKGMELAKSVTRKKTQKWEESLWDIKTDSYANANDAKTSASANASASASANTKAANTKANNKGLRIVAFDYGCKSNILRCLASFGCEVVVVPATSSADDVLALKPDGLFLSNGPGDPAATADYSSATIRTLAEGRSIAEGPSPAERRRPISRSAIQGLIKRRNPANNAPGSNLNPSFVLNHSLTTLLNDPLATADYSNAIIPTPAEGGNLAEGKNPAKKGLPIFGICIGHQLIAEAFGAKTFKMPRGHRGANHPVKNIRTGKIEITSQNHGFAVDPQSLTNKDIEVTHISLFDGSIEGIRHKTLPVFSVQYHPEASPGPHDAHYLFERFVEMIKEHKNAAP